MWPFTKHCKRTKISKETGDSNQVHQIDLDQTQFSHDGVCANGEDLTKRIISDNILKDRACQIAINPNYDE